MSAPNELEVWSREWRAVAAVPSDLRARVDRGTRRLRVMRVVDLVVTVTIGGWTTGWAMLERSPDVIGLAVMTWAFLALAWTFALINRAGLWSPEAVTVSAFLELSILRVRRSLMAAAFGSVLYIVELAFCLGWIYVRLGARRGAGPSAFLTSWPVMIVWACTAGFYVGLGWYVWRRRAELKSLMRTARELDPETTSAPARPGSPRGPGSAPRGMRGSRRAASSL
jgi:hypothetical protein